MALRFFMQRRFTLLLARVSRNRTINAKMTEIRTASGRQHVKGNVTARRMTRNQPIHMNHNATTPTMRLLIITNRTPISVITTQHFNGTRHRAIQGMNGTFRRRQAAQRIVRAMISRIRHNVSFISARFRAKGGITTLLTISFR